MNNPFLIGKRIYLRPLTRADSDRCLRWINDPTVISTLGRKFPTGRSQEEEWLANQYRSNSGFSLAIVVKQTDQHIGNCGFNDIDYVNRKAMVGIMIGESNRWDQGYGTEAIRLLLEYGFEQLNMHRIALTVYSHNARAIRAYEKAGFIHEGRMREALFRDGRYYDTLLMGILRSEWDQMDASE